MDNTRDFSKFGFRELGLAGELLTAASDNKFEREDDKTNFLGANDLEIEMNPNSGYVFFTDDEGNAFMLNDNGKVQLWRSCFECGHEDFDNGQFFVDGCEECKK